MSIISKIFNGPGPSKGSESKNVSSDSSKIPTFPGQPRPPNPPPPVAMEPTAVPSNYSSASYQHPLDATVHGAGAPNNTQQRPVVETKNNNNTTNASSYWANLPVEEKIKALLEAVQELEKNNNELKEDINNLSAALTETTEALSARLENHTHLMNGDYVVVRQ